MNDTHGEKGEGWIGFDLDGTLAKYDGWKGIDHIGEPVGPMVDTVKKMHADGRRVKVLTARVAPHKLEDGTTGEAYITVPGEDGGSTRQYARQYVADWCHFNLGFVPEITHEKDHLMLDLYDDRCHQVVPNTGEVVEEQRNRWRALAVSERAYSKSIAEDAKLDRRRCFLAGVFAGAVVIALVAAGFDAYLYSKVSKIPEAELKQALQTYLEAKAHEQSASLTYEEGRQ